MAKKPFEFQANTDSISEAYGGSLFKDLFKARNGLLLEKSLPKVSKGIALPELSSTMGSAKYSFKLGEVADKIVAKDKEKEITARYKKDTKKFDISLKANASDSLDYLVKYEEKGLGAPHYVGGVTYTVKGLLGAKSITCDAKFNPFTGLLKGSTMLDYVDLGLKAAADAKVNTSTMALAKYNVGVLYNSPIGTMNLTLASSNLLTFSLVKDLSKEVSVACEAVQALPGGPAPKCPLAAGASYKLDKEHTVKARVNSSLGFQVGLEKVFMPGFSMLVATAVNLKDPSGAMGAMPSFGIKVVAK